MSFALKTASAGIWTVGGKLASKLIDFVALLIFSRLLEPKDFGLVAIAMVIVQIVEMILEVPLVAAVGKFENLTKDVIDTAFTVGVLRAVAISIIMMLVSFPASLFYSDHRLMGLLLVLSLAPAMRGLLSPALLSFSLRMDFRRDSALDVAGKAVALVVGTTIAVLFHSYWALVAATVSVTFTMMVLSYIICPYRPTVSLKEWHLFKSLLGWNSFSQLMQAVNWQVDRIILPKFIPVSDFGQFSNGANLASIPAQAILQPIGRPLFVALAAKNTGEELVSAYEKSIYAIFAMTAPVLVLMAMLSDEIIRLLLGPNWAGAAPVLQVLALSSAVALTVVAMPSLALAQGRPGLVSGKTAIELSVKVPSILILVPLYGVTGALAAQFISTLAMVAASMFAVQKLIDVNPLKQARALTRPLAALAVMAVVVMALKYLVGPIGTGWEVLVLHLVMFVAIGAAAYGALLFGLWGLSGRPSGLEAILVSQVHRLCVRS